MARDALERRVVEEKLDLALAPPLAAQRRDGAQRVAQVARADHQHAQLVGRAALGQELVARAQQVQRGARAPQPVRAEPFHRGADRAAPAPCKADPDRPARARAVPRQPGRPARGARLTASCRRCQRQPSHGALRRRRPPAPSTAARAGSRAAARRRPCSDSEQSDGSAASRRPLAAACSVQPAAQPAHGGRLLTHCQRASSLSLRSRSSATEPQPAQPAQLRWHAARSTGGGGAGVPAAAGEQSTGRPCCGGRGARASVSRSAPSQAAAEPYGAGRPRSARARGRASAAIRLRLSARRVGGSRPAALRRTAEKRRARRARAPCFARVRERREREGGRDGVLLGAACE